MNARMKGHMLRCRFSRTKLAGLRGFCRVAGYMDCAIRRIGYVVFARCVAMFFKSIGLVRPQHSFICTVSVTLINP